MDYKSTYLEAFKRTIDELDLKIISHLKTSKERNKNFTALFNSINDDLRSKEENLKTSLLKNNPALLEAFQSRYEEYESDHLSSFFQFDFLEILEIYPQGTLINMAKKIGNYDGVSLAFNNFSNSFEFLETVYVLNKNYEYYSLGFDPDNIPQNSELFYQMHKERFPKNNQPIWEETIIKESKRQTPIIKDDSEKLEKVENQIAPGDILEDNEKLYILHLLKEFTHQGSEIKTTEFLRILHLSASIIDFDNDLSGTLPNYRKVNDGWISFPKNERINRIETIIAKLSKFNLPVLKKTINQKLQSERRKR
jgi:ferritin-like metal-binding protein YciE